MGRGFCQDEAPEFSYSRTLTYVSIPVMTHIYFGSQKFRGFSILGPVGFLLGSSIDANFDYDNYKNIPNFPQGSRI